MATVSVSLPSDGSTADVSDVNTPITTIVNEINGNLDNANIKTGAAIATSKLADDAGITTAKIADGAVTAAKIDWASTGANGGIWWEEIGRTTLASAGDTITVSSLPARKYLKIITSFTATGGTAVPILRFNNDTGSNYAHRFSDSGGADTTQTSQGSLLFRAGSIPSGGNQYVELEISNIASLEKNGCFTAVGTVTSTGAATAPGRVEGAVKWANTSDQISRVDVGHGGTGDFAIGSEVVVLGHN